MVIELNDGPPFMCREMATYKELQRVAVAICKMAYSNLIVPTPEQIMFLHSQLSKDVLRIVDDPNSADLQIQAVFNKVLDLILSLDQTTVFRVEAYYFFEVIRTYNRLKKFALSCIDRYKKDTELGSTQFHIWKDFENEFKQREIIQWRTRHHTLEELGSGGFGVVYKVEDKKTNKEYAVKKIPYRLIDITDEETIFKESDHLMRLNHQNVVTYYYSWLTMDDAPDSEQSSSSTGMGPSSTGSSEGDSEQSGLSSTVTYCIQMELCHSTLEIYLQNRNYGSNIKQDVGGATDVLSLVNSKESNDVFAQIITGVEFIHSRGVIHRDLKPSNIFLDKGKNVKIGDFGLARTIQYVDSAGSSMCNHTAKVGTFSYAAPEQLLSTNYDQKADIYSLGIILFELFYPFGSAAERADVLTNLRQKNGDISEVKTIRERFGLVADAIVKLLKKEPCERPFAQDIQRLMENV